MNMVQSLSITAESLNLQVSLQSMMSVLCLSEIQYKKSAMHHVCTCAVHHLFYKKLSLEILYIKLFSVLGGRGFCGKEFAFLSRYRLFSGHSAVRHLLIITVLAAGIKLV